MQVTSERSDNGKHRASSSSTERIASNYVTVSEFQKINNAVSCCVNKLSSAVYDVRTEIFDKSSSDAFYMTELQKSVDRLVKVQYYLVTLYCFVCVCLLALVIVLSLAFL